MGWHDSPFPKYVPVAERKKRSEQQAKKYAKKNKSEQLQPIVVQGRLAAKTFWGKAWFNNLTRYQDYENRVGRGRSYVSHGAVIDLKIRKGEVHALVCGTRTYTVHIAIASLTKAAWSSVIKECSGKINSLVELLEGTFSKHIMSIVTQPDKGLFPQPSEISFDCSCPDHASMCKHVSAVLYGVGIRLDETPEHLFLLRSVNHTELLASALNEGVLGGQQASTVAQVDGDLSQLFGVELDGVEEKASSKPTVKVVKSRTKKPKK